MILKLLRKLFIKNYKDLENPKIRNSHGVLASVVGIISNLILFGAKMFIGIVSFSFSIISDSINNLVDMSSSFISLFGFKISSKPADKDHPYGHQRVEYITALIISVAVIAIAIELIIQSIENIINSNIATFSIVTFIILGISILIKVWQGFFYLKVSKLTKSLSLKANAIDSFCDVISTTAVLISSLLSYYFSWNIDSYVAIAVGLFIIFNGVKMLLESANPLIGESVDKDVVNKITEEVLSYDGILGVHDVIAHSYGPSSMFMSAHLEVDAKIDILSSHDLVDCIEEHIKTKYKIFFVAHMDPIDLSNPETLRLKSIADNKLKEISSELTLHDFRVVYGNTHTNILFDVVIPFEFKVSQDDIVKQIENCYFSNEHKYNVIINFDHPYVN